MTKEKYICIHAHFYQPPRENPWLEAVELQDSAYPFHDWNERVTAECYAPNGTARLFDQAGRIKQIVNNYARISFNFGPTLLAWMKEQALDVYEAILEADRQSRERYSGHGSALAQAYNHLIMPLAHPRDQRTQVIWGLRDFEFRFGHPAEGMWLPETAVNYEILEIMAELGVKFTILSPFQASHVRLVGGRKWQDVSGGHIDPSRPYLVQLPSGRKISIFFYDAPVSQGVAFEGLLCDGSHFARRLMDGFDARREGDQLVHIATDGESYGHHHRYGEMALAYALHHIEANHLARLTNYGEFLAAHAPRWEVRIHPNSAWSCAHGVERWKSDCGCNSGGHPGWNQAWRSPLRQSLDWLRDQLAPRFEAKAGEFLKEPWQARDDYISIIADRAPEMREAFFARHGRRSLSPEEQVTVLRLLEIQRHAMLMYTSCGWFCDEISGPESVQIIQYAARAIQLAGDLLGKDLEPGFLDRLAQARSNLPEHRDGRQIYETFVRPAIIDREKVGAHYAVSSLFEAYPAQARIYSFTAEQEDRQSYTSGNTRLALGRVKVTFEITQNSDVITYAVLHLGDHNINCGVRHYQDAEAYATMALEMKEAFDRVDLPRIIRLMDAHFGESNYSLKSLFRDEQRKVLNQILGATRNDIHSAFRLLTDRYTPLLRFLAGLHAPPPHALRMAVEFMLNSELRCQFESEVMDLERVRSLLAECERDNLGLDADTLGYALKEHLERLSVQLQKTPDDLGLLARLADVASLLRSLPFELNLWKSQNLHSQMFNSLYPVRQAQAVRGDSAAQEWITRFQALGEHLGFAVNP